MNKYPTQDEMRAGWEKRGRGLDFDVATEVMGWKVAWIPPAYDGHFGAEPYWKGPGTPEHNGGIWSEWQPSRDLNLCAQAEARLMERGLGTAYAYALRDVVGPLIQEHQLPLILATPEQRCRAMLAAMRERGAR